MNIVLDPLTEARLRAIANARHLSLESCLAQIVENIPEPPPSENSAEGLKDSLIDFLRRSPLWGANLDLERVQDYLRTIDLECMVSARYQRGLGVQPRTNARSAS